VSDLDLARLRERVEQGLDLGPEAGRALIERLARAERALDEIATGGKNISPTARAIASDALRGAQRSE
jgi:hypothetical protein